MNTNYLKNLCTKLGINNKPTYVVMSIAAVKGVCRPLFTMMDKKEEPKTKKYTAIREGLTEVIAIPIYWACGELSAKCANFLPKDLQTNGKKNMMFIGVCTAALFIIPALCSAAIKPLMNRIYHNNDNSKPNQAPVQPNVLPAVIKPPVNKISSINTFANRPQSGLRVGGL